MFFIHICLYHNEHLIIKSRLFSWSNCTGNVAHSGWEPINTNIPESIGVGSQYCGLNIGFGVEYWTKELINFKYWSWFGQDLDQTKTNKRNEKFFPFYYLASELGLFGYLQQYFIIHMTGTVTNPMNEVLRSWQENVCWGLRDKNPLFVQRAMTHFYWLFG